VKNGQEARLPSLKTSRISALLRRRCCTRVERCAMTDPIRPSACAVLWPGDAPESVGHPLSSSAHEIHGCVCAPYSTAAASSRTSETSVSKIPVRSRAAIIGAGARPVKHRKLLFRRLFYNATSAREVLNLDLVDIEFRKCRMHARHHFVEPQRLGLLGTKPDRVDASHYKALQIGAG
jgi:hypothetical protein